MLTLRKLVPVLSRAAAAVAVLSAGALADVTGNSNPLLYQKWAGEVPYRGFQVKYIFALTRGPVSGNAPARWIVAFAPPVDFERDRATGKPRMHVDSPGAGGPFTFRTPDGRTATCPDGDTLARAVQAGQVGGQVQVLLSCDLRLQNDTPLKQAVLHTAGVQVHIDEEKPPLSADDALQRVILLPTTTTRVACLTPGFEVVSFELKGSPEVGGKIHFQALVPASFVSQAFSAGGVQMGAEFYYEASAESIAELAAQRFASDFVDLFVRENGLGDFVHKAGGDSSRVNILVTRDQVEQVARDSKWQEKLFLRGASTDDINVLLGLWQKNDSDVFAVNEKQVEDFFGGHQKMLELANQPGVARDLQEASNQESFSEDQFERARKWLSLVNDHAEGGGGGSFLGIISLGGGGGSDNTTANAGSEQERRRACRFFRDLKEVRLHGTFPVHPSLEYRVVAKRKIDRALETSYEWRKPGRVTTNRLTSVFNSASRTLPIDDTLDRRRRAAEEALRDADELIRDSHSR